MLSNDIQSDGCSLWPDGIPTFLGGSGQEWLHCCAAHDASQLTISDHWTLMQCMSDTGHPVIGVITFVGLVLFCGIYIGIKRKLSGKSEEIADGL